ncbi:MAG: FkbM family methyltransferase [Acidiferrobacterales bacterium]
MTDLLRRLANHLRHEQKPVRWLASRLVSRLGLGPFLKIDRGLFRVRLFPTGMSLGAWDNTHAYRSDELFLRSQLKSGDFVVDVGANVGFLTLAAAALVGSSGNVISFEAHPVTFSYLRSNVRLNGFTNIALRQSALGNYHGTISFSDRDNDDVNSVADAGSLNVPITTLDQELQSHHGRISLLKVDVEGYEKFVFEGAQDVLRRTDCIYFEVSEENFRKFNYRTTDVLNFLAGHGFDFYRISDAGDEIRLASDFIPAYCMNLIGRRANL